jgi:hypothetical protein
VELYFHSASSPSWRGAQLKSTRITLPLILWGTDTPILHDGSVDYTKYENNAKMLEMKYRTHVAGYNLLDYEPN